jgi:hypothetical protein
VTDLSSIELPYPLAGRPPVANPAGREYGGGLFEKTNREKKRGLQKASSECSRLCVTTRGKTAEKNPSSEPKKNGGNAQENNYRRDYKINPVCLHFYLVL